MASWHENCAASMKPAGGPSATERLNALLPRVAAWTAASNTQCVALWLHVNLCLCLAPIFYCSGVIHCGMLQKRPSERSKNPSTVLSFDLLVFPLK